MENLYDTYRKSVPRDGYTHPFFHENRSKGTGVFKNRNLRHLLLMLNRHTPDLFPMTVEERLALFALIDDCREVIEENFRPAGYNTGFNTGAAAGQTVMHCHCHMIPRYVGDVREPRGGIRGVVIGRQIY
ncbi:MAG: HIT family protein [Methanoregula sp.]